MNIKRSKFLKEVSRRVSVTRNLYYTACSKDIMPARRTAYTGTIDMSITWNLFRWPLVLVSRTMNYIGRVFCCAFAVLLPVRLLYLHSPDRAVSLRRLWNHHLRTELYSRDVIATINRMFSGFFCRPADTCSQIKITSKQQLIRGLQSRRFLWFWGKCASTSCCVKIDNFLQSSA